MYKTIIKIIRREEFCGNGTKSDDEDNFEADDDEDDQETDKGNRWRRRAGN